MAKPNVSASTAIDCPENGQAYGKRAKQAASELVYGKEITLQTFGKERISTGAPLLVCSCPMKPTSITRWSKKAGAGDIGNTRRGIACWRS